MYEYFKLFIKNIIEKITVLEAEEEKKKLEEDRKNLKDEKADVIEV